MQAWSLKEHAMKRRSLLATPLRLALGSAVYLAWPMVKAEQARPSYTVPAAKLEQAVAQRFPLRLPVGGLVEISVQPPRLRLLPAQNRLGADMVVGAAGQALRRAYTGTFDLDFALRYESSDLSIRAQQLRVNALQFDGLAPQPSALLAAYGPALAEQALQDAVLHTFKPQDLALPDGMGLQPGSITVTAQGLVIGFVTKPML
jgi:hypothetical protein